MAALRNRLIGTIKRWIGALIGDERLARQGELGQFVGAIQGRVEQIERELRAEIAPVVHLDTRRKRRVASSRR